MNTAVLIPVLANDTPSSGNPIDPKHLKIERKPSNGVATALSNGQVRYTPKAGFTGTDTFTYTVKGKRGPKSNVATVTVSVQSGQLGAHGQCRTGPERRDRPARDLGWIRRPPIPTAA